MDSHQRRVARRAKNRSTGFLSDLLGQWEPKPKYIEPPQGTLWIYRQYPVVLPQESTFKVLFTWGSEAEHVAVKVNLLGHYTSKIEIA